MNNNNMKENASNQEELNKKSQPTFLMVPDSIRYINGLSQSDIIVYCVIYQYCKASSFDGNPIEADTIVTNEEIANRANISPISVVRAIKKLKEIRYALMFVALMFLLVLCSSIVDFNYIDLIYLTFIVISIIRYVLLCLKDWIIPENTV